MNATDIQYIPSDAAVVRAVPKSYDHPYGVMPVDAITADVPTIVVLSGDLSYFSQNDAHLFVVSQISKNMASEHNGTGLKLADSDILTEDGKVLFAAERNALINSVRTTGVPNVAALVHGEMVDFESMKHSGDWFYKMMLADIKSQMQQNPKRGNQK